MLTTITSSRFDKWLTRLKDSTAKARIIKQVQRIQLAEQYVGDWKPVGGGVVELRLDFGPGYRLYISIQGESVLILLAGGDKSTQNSDIEAARQLLMEWRSNGFQRV